MRRILATIGTLAEHVRAVVMTPEIYRPVACPHCHLGGLWRHGCYFRKADRRPGGGSLNPVAVLRFICHHGCSRTCSRLPACISPRRWYDWAVQQVVLALLLSGCSVRQCSLLSERAPRTVRRWRDWLDLRGEQFEFFLRSRFPELGRLPDRDSFWREVFASLSLAQAMAWLDLDRVVP
jgi:hypothetical protein